jgi:DNA-binding transcriptional LysR family regulator
MMDDRDWELIKTLYEQKNITKTARTMFISQPALTARIKAIEAFLGVKLIHRGNRGVTFTAAGETAAEFALKYIAAIKDLKISLSTENLGVAGIIKIGATPVIARSYLPSLLNEFRNMYPKAEFEIFVEQSSDIVKKLYSDTYDFGFVRNCFHWNEQNRIFLGKDTISIASAKAVSEEILPNMVRVSYRQDQYLMYVLEEWWNERFAVKPSIGIKVDNVDICRGMVLNGTGYAIIPTVFVANIFGLHQFIVKDKNGKPYELSTWLIYNKHDVENVANSTFLEFVRSYGQNVLPNECF